MTEVRESTTYRHTERMALYLGVDSRGIVLAAPKVPETIEGKTDYLQEYEVQDLCAGNKPLWYAHFHYASLQAPDQQPTAAHLKTAAQRRLGREYENNTGQRVYRGPLANAAAREIFLGSPVA
ncbi:hypothetical protein [Pseudomonas canadensis]|uniref:hypothetical protein n=1 Tax=Pseudomonas canadensis TaxID=915099 RepID=UPI0028930633|nr:hypothetical protein [Pseudomonas canadensis]WNJ84645.1 hypothetical protein RMQ99_26645 [Pseudomonas canadensis]